MKNPGMHAFLFFCHYILHIPIGCSTFAAAKKKNSTNTHTNVMTRSELHQTISAVLFAIVFAAVATPPASALPARRVPVTCTQSDGTTITLYLTGDEFGHYYTDSNGTPMHLNEEGMYVPSTLWQVATLRERSAARRAEAATQRAADAASRVSVPYRAPSHRTATVGSSSHPTGSQRVLVILAQFTDMKFAQDDPQAAFKQHLNKENYTDGPGYGSARDYFTAQSNGIFTPQFDVYGPYTAAHNLAYYGGNDDDGNDKAPGELVSEVIKLANADINYKDYDNDNNGVVDFCYVIYAGYGEAQSGIADAIWPHQWSLSSATGSALKLDGVQINSYACSNERHGNSGTDIEGIGPLCHEFSHSLGLPDFYDTEGDHNGMFCWSLMDYGPYNENQYTPCSYTAYEKDFLGWLELETLDSEQTVTLTPTDRGGKGYRIISSENTDEYYVVENIQQKGWNRGARAHGMLVTHVDYLSSAWYSNTVNNYDRQRMTIVPADNEWLRTNASAARDLYPGPTANTELSDTSIPAALTNDGNSFSQPITNICEAEDGTITFSFMKGCGDVTTANPATDVTATSFTANWKKRLRTEDYKLEVYHITGDIPANSDEWNAALLNDQGELIQTIHKTGTSTTITNLEADNLYGYRVRCLKDGLLSPPSNVVWVSTGSYDKTSLAAPTLSTPIVVSDSILSLHWSAVEGATGYTIEYEQTRAKGDEAIGDGSLMFEEKFNDVESNCGDISRVMDIYTEQPDWRGQQVHAGSGEIRLGSKEEYGYLLTPYLPHSSDYVTIYFSVRKYNEADNRPIIFICLASDADTEHYTDQLGAYVTNTDYQHYYCVLGPLDTSSYIAWISDSETDSDDSPIVCLDNLAFYWGDLSSEIEGLTGAQRLQPALSPSPLSSLSSSFTQSDILSAPVTGNHRLPASQPLRITTSKKKYVAVTDTTYMLSGLETGTYSIRVRATQGSAASPYSNTCEQEAGNTTFIVDGLCYDIVSEEMRTVALQPLRNGQLYEGDIIVPETIQHNGTYTVRELADSVFRGCSDLHSVIIPSSVSFAGAKIFKGCKHLAWVDWQSTAAIDASDFIGTAYNTLVYVNSDVVVDSKDVIVIRDGQADSITVNLNSPFVVPRAFQARYIENIKDFSQKTYVGQCAGWETIAMPFDVQHVSIEDTGTPLTPYGSDTTGQHFWLGAWNGTAFTTATAMKANMPYIVAFPNSESYNTDDCIQGSIVFSADNVTVESTVDVSGVTGQDYDFVPVYEKIYKSPDIYTLNTYDEAVAGALPGSTFIADRMSLRTFGAYMRPHNAHAAPHRFPLQFINVNNNEDDDTSEYEGPIYTLDGRCIRSAAQGTSGLPHGIYIIAGKKVIL